MTAAEHLTAAEGYLTAAIGASELGLHDGAALNIQAAIAHAIMAMAIEAGVPHLGQSAGGVTDAPSTAPAPA